MMGPCVRWVLPTHGRAEGGQRGSVQPDGLLREDLVLLDHRVRLCTECSTIASVCACGAPARLCAKPCVRVCVRVRVCVCCVCMCARVCMTVRNLQRSHAGAVTNTPACARAHACAHNDAGLHIMVDVIVLKQPLRASLRSLLSGTGPPAAQCRPARVANPRCAQRSRHGGAGGGGWQRRSTREYTVAGPL
jgi:hypothetical protein